MPTDPYVPERLGTEPRQHPNLAPGVSMPAAAPWRADRPGDLGAGQPRGTLLGSPGPNVGYALSLVQRRRDAFRLANGERFDDVAAVVAEIAMRRASSFGRAPVVADIDVAMTLLGYDRDPSPDVVGWRVPALQEAVHEYSARRVIVDAVPIEALRSSPAQATTHAAASQLAVRHAVASHDGSA